MCLRLSPGIPTRPPPCYFPARFASRRAHDTGTNPELNRIQNSRIVLFFKTERLLIHQRDLFFLSFTSSIRIFTACDLVSEMKRIIKIAKVEEILLLSCGASMSVSLCGVCAQTYPSTQITGGHMCVRTFTSGPRLQTACL